METAAQIMEREHEAAMKMRHLDRRARLHVDYAVSRALQDIGEPDGDNYRQYVRDVATEAAALLIRAIYEDDGELKALRMERDKLEELALQGLTLRPLVVPTVRGEDLATKDRS